MKSFAVERTFQHPALQPQKGCVMLTLSCFVLPCLRRVLPACIPLVLSAVLPVAVRAQTPVATYLFSNTLAAQQVGRPGLTATNPLSQNGFETANVFGQNRTVYHTSGTTTTSEQAGLTLNTTGLLPSNTYSVEMVFSFSDRDSAWRRIIDVENRQSDNGFYVNPGNQLALFPVTGGATFTNNEYQQCEQQQRTDELFLGRQRGPRRILECTHRPDSRVRYRAYLWAGGSACPKPVRGDGGTGTKRRIVCGKRSVLRRPLYPASPGMCLNGHGAAQTATRLCAAPISSSTLRLLTVRSHCGRCDGGT